MLALSAALFVSGIAFIIAGARTAAAAEPASPTVELTPVANIRQLMNGIVAPTSAVIYRSVGTVITAKGVENTAPCNDAEWAHVANNAAALAEAGNLLMLGGRMVDQDDWVQFSRDLINAASTALKAADAKSTDGILEAGTEINDTCDNCHAKYQRQ
jgi:hypothetical protein